MKTIPAALITRSAAVPARGPVAVPARVPATAPARRSAAVPARGSAAVLARGLAVVLAAVVALVAGGVPAAAAAAGGWAVTYLDPSPSRFEGGKPYAMAFWVLQHGTHPFEGQDLGPVGLRLTGEDGKSLLFGGTALPEKGHYATSVVVPEGVWKVEGIQGMFQPYDVGTLTVPGALKVNPVDPELIAAVKSSGQSYWGAVRPPGFPPGAAAAKAGQPEAAATASPPATGAPGLGQAQGQAESATGASADEPAKAANAAGGEGAGAGGVPAYTLLIAAVGGALLAVAALRLPVMSRLWRSARRSRHQEDEPDPPVDSAAETIVISGR
ncbi:hypothetical protein [Nonomuraea zeae]|uniref:Uncharacterized protein n=1 Tax=Nonomuraea zeae TaxID=1642303 RepID=A0A5S4GE21_9ACTN|nr:hypothetical protein [Nonomuraea zeae]TMR31243.1 hypothetical protein ETD85_26660 [Nonomuraea zeae]